MNNSQFSIIGFIAITLLLWLFNGDMFWSAAGVSFTIFIVYRFLCRIGQEIPIKESIVMMAGMQWIVGPYIAYRSSVTHYKYHMYVDEAIYMEFAVPVVIFMWLGIMMFKSSINLAELKERVNNLLSKYPKFPYILVAIGIFIPFINPLIPPSLRFVIFLLSNVKYIGATYLLLSTSSNRWIIYGVIMMFTISASLASGMFHDLLLWGLLTFTFVSRELNFRFIHKVSLFVAGVMLAMTIQAVKPTYRSMTYTGKAKGGIGLFTSLAVAEWKEGTIINPTDDNDINVRLNQGWIISAIMKHVPTMEPYSGGATISDAVYSSLLPRFLAPDKVRAGGRDNFTKYTGLPLGENTSMGISLAGEAWANYGYWGGLFFMFLWGLFLSWFWKKLISLSKYYPTLLIWSPILFLQVVKAETELVVVLNHLIKAAILVFGLLWFIKKQWRVRV